MEKCEERENMLKVKPFCDVEGEKNIDYHSIDANTKVFIKEAELGIGARFSCKKF